jgi:hypothetical protein
MTRQKSSFSHAARVLDCGGDDAAFNGTSRRLIMAGKRSYYQNRTTASPSPASRRSGAKADGAEGRGEGELNTNILRRAHSPAEPKTKPFNLRAAAIFGSLWKATEGYGRFTTFHVATEGPPGGTDLFPLQRFSVSTRAKPAACGRGNLHKDDELLHRISGDNLDAVNADALEGFAVLAAVARCNGCTGDFIQHIAAFD